MDSRQSIRDDETEDETTAERPKVEQSGTACPSTYDSLHRSPIGPGTRGCVRGHCTLGPLSRGHSTVSRREPRPSIAPSAKKAALRKSECLVCAGSASHRQNLSMYIGRYVHPLSIFLPAAKGAKSRKPLCSIGMCLAKMTWLAQAHTAIGPLADKLDGTPESVTDWETGFGWHKKMPKLPTNESPKFDVSFVSTQTPLLIKGS